MNDNILYYQKLRASGAQLGGEDAPRRRELRRSSTKEE